jgi:hypothetical protein
MLSQCDIFVLEFTINRGPEITLDLHPIGKVPLRIYPGGIKTAGYEVPGKKKKAHLVPQGRSIKGSCKCNQLATGDFCCVHIFTWR